MLFQEIGAVATAIHGGAGVLILKHTLTQAPAAAAKLSYQYPGPLRLIGVGPHGIMNAWLEPDEDGWSGRWDYLGDGGDVRLRALGPAVGRRPAVARDVQAEVHHPIRDVHARRPEQP